MLPNGPLVDSRGRRMWADLPAAYRYAEARWTLYGTRQMVRPARVDGALMWYVVRARQVAVTEPCS